jgi:Kae1-associated kinase Bud32
MKKLIYEGAEAKVFLENNLIIKQRIYKKYRNKSLNDKILKQRTKAEGSILRKAYKLGISCPEVIKEDLENYTLYLSYIKADPLRKYPNDKEKLISVGKEIAKMHNHHIIHGDLTAQNIFYGDKPIFLDFGLAFNSQKLEDFATDLAVLKGTILADFSKKTWDYILEGYIKNTKHEIEKKLDEIERRKRYLG